MKAIQVVRLSEIKIIEKEIPKNIGSKKVLFKTKAVGIASRIFMYIKGYLRLPYIRE